MSHLGVAVRDTAEQYPAEQKPREVARDVKESCHVMCCEELTGDAAIDRPEGSPLPQHLIYPWKPSACAMGSPSRVRFYGWVRSLVAALGLERSWSRMSRSKAADESENTRVSLRYRVLIKGATDALL